MAVALQNRTEANEHLIAGEAIHQAILDWLPAVRQTIEFGAGTGRLTVHLARKAQEVIAIEPAAQLRESLRARLCDDGVQNARIIHGFF